MFTSCPRHLARYHPQPNHTMATSPSPTQKILVPSRKQLAPQSYFKLLSQPRMEPIPRSGHSTDCTTKASLENIHVIRSLIQMGIL